VFDNKTQRSRVVVLRLGMPGGCLGDAWGMPEGCLGGCTCLGDAWGMCMSEGMTRGMLGGCLEDSWGIPGGYLGDACGNA
jgi:hypothetical protein